MTTLRILAALAFVLLGAAQLNSRNKPEYAAHRGVLLGSGLAGIVAGLISFVLLSWWPLLAGALIVFAAGTRLPDLRSSQTPLPPEEEAESVLRQEARRLAGHNPAQRLHLWMLEHWPTYAQVWARDSGLEAAPLPPFLVYLGRHETGATRIARFDLTSDGLDNILEAETCDDIAPAFKPYVRFYAGRPGTHDYFIIGQKALVSYEPQAFDLLGERIKAVTLDIRRRDTGIDLYGHVHHIEAEGAIPLADLFLVLVRYHFCYVTDAALALERWGQRASFPMFDHWGNTPMEPGVFAELQAQAPPQLREYLAAHTDQLLGQ